MLIRPAQPIATTIKTANDRRAVFVTLSNESGIIDLLIPQRTERFGQLRCIYIDTSGQDSSGNGCTIETDLGQNVRAPAGTQGYYPVFIPFVSKLNVNSNQAVNLLLLDFDVQPSQWQVSNAPDPQHVVIDGQPINTNATVGNFPATFGATQSGAWNVGVNNFPAGFNVNNFPASQHVTLDAQPINTNATVGNFPAAFGATQSGAWSVSVNNFPTTSPLSANRLNSGIASTSTFTIISGATFLTSIGIIFFNVTSPTNAVLLYNGASLFGQILFPALTNYSNTLVMDNLAISIPSNFNIALANAITGGEIVVTGSGR